MTDRSLPGIQPGGEGGRRGAANRRTFGCLGVFIGVIVLVGACTAIVSFTRDRSDDYNNQFTAIRRCEDLVTQQLKSPSTAEFDSSASGDGTWTVIGYVDAQNGFGAMVRSEFGCTVVIRGNTADTTLEYLR